MCAVGPGAECSRSGSGEARPPRDSLPREPRSAGSIQGWRSAPRRVGERRRFPLSDARTSSRTCASGAPKKGHPLAEALRLPSAHAEQFSDSLFRVLPAREHAAVERPGVGRSGVKYQSVALRRQQADGFADDFDDAGLVPMPSGRRRAPLGRRVVRACHDSLPAGASPKRMRGACWSTACLSVSAASAAAASRARRPRTRASKPPHAAGRRRRTPSAG